MRPTLVLSFCPPNALSTGVAAPQQLGWARATDKVRHCRAGFRACRFRGLFSPLNQRLPGSRRWKAPQPAGWKACPTDFVASAFLVLIGGATFLCLNGCSKPIIATPPPVVQVMEISGTNMPASAEFIGQLDSPQNVEVRARVEAFVDKMAFVEGTDVKQDDLLFALDDKPYQERLLAAKGSLAEAQAALKKYEADVARLTPLAAKRAVPQQDLDNALASVDMGKAAVLTAQARVESAQLDVGYCQVKAPVAGLIGAKQVNLGELVGKGQPTLLVTLSTLDPIWFYCNVSEVEYLRAQEKTRLTGKQVQDLPVNLVLANGASYPDQGKFVFIDRAVDPKTGTLRVRAEFANATKVLRPGMFGRIKVDLGVRPDSILVPERSIVELQGKSFVWVVAADNKASQRTVKVGDQLGSNVNVLEGLKAGDRIVVEGLQKLREGAAVQPMTAMQMAQAGATPAEAKPAQE